MKLIKNTDNETRMINDKERAELELFRKARQGFEDCQAFESFIESQDQFNKAA